MLILVLLAATAASFAVSERLKLETVPIDRTHVINKVFSPVCGCIKRVATVDFRLRRADRVTFSILSMDRHLVRRLAAKQHFAAGKASFTWNGRDEEGVLQPDGTYRVRVELARHGRTINLPNLIRIDTRKPVVTSTARPRPAHISPDGDRHGDFVEVAYAVSEHAQGILYLKGRRIVLGRFQKLRDHVLWYGLKHGKGLPAGRYRLAVGARDPAGNLAKPVPAGTVEIRYMALEPSVVRVGSKQRFRVTVLTDAKAYRWRIGHRHGFGAGPILRLRAPAAPGRHVLYVEERGHAARAVLLVHE